MPRVNDAVKWVEYTQEFENAQGASETLQFRGWIIDKKRAASNCALCTAAALITDKIDDPNWRKTSGIVNGDLQGRLVRLLGEQKMNTIWGQNEWKEKQIDDAFVLYTFYALQPRVRPMKDPNLQRFSDQIIGLAGYVEQKLVEQRPQIKVQYHGFPENETTPATAVGFMRRQPDGTKFAVCTDQQPKNYGMSLHWTYAEKRGGKISYKDFQLDRDGMPEPQASDYPLGPDRVVYKRNDILMLVLAFGNNVVA
jgi:hypothetical protein